MKQFIFHHSYFILHHFIFHHSITVAFQSKTYRSTLFQSFKAIDAGEFGQVVRYYERHKKDVLKLDFDEYFEIKVAYTRALFEMGEYQKHILMADSVIETSILENLSMVNGQEIFQSMLFKKAASHYNLLEYKKAIHVLRELLKIEPKSYENARFLEQCLRKDKPKIARDTRAVAIFLFLSAALTISIEMLFVRNFSIDLVPFIEISRNIMFGLGLFILLIGSFWHRWTCYNEVQKFIIDIKRNKIQRLS
jgi:tetratricopeptide (TPR) repeat protein